MVVIHSSPLPTTPPSNTPPPSPYPKLLEEGWWKLLWCIPHPRCDKCDMFIPQDALEAGHLGIAFSRWGRSRSNAILRPLMLRNKQEWSSGCGSTCYRGWRHLSTLYIYCHMVTVTGQRWMGTFGRCGVNGIYSPACLSRREKTLGRLGGSTLQWCNLSFYLGHRRGL